MDDISLNSFEHFRKLVLERADLQFELRRFTDKETFIECVTQLGGKHGYEFTRDDVAEGLRAAWQSWIERAI